MYSEEDYIYGEFSRNFSGKKSIPIALYGIGRNTKKLLPKIQDYNIAGLMDGKRSEGEIYGKRILDYADILHLGIKIIVIIARPAVIGVIYHRVSGFCKKNGVAVYDVKGNDLSRVYVDKEHDIPYFHLDWKDLKEEIEKHEIITFDIFDTLVMRKTLYPEDIFWIVESKYGKPFAELRIEAERNLYSQNQNPTIYEIYEEFQRISGISDEWKNRFLEEEICTEMEFVAPRESIRSLFNSIKGRKRVFLISDMYLTKDLIEQMLKKCGYQDYEGIYVSCETGKAKDGGLFDIFLDNIKGCKSCLHIGDNYIADIMGAKASGMDAFQVMSVRELLESSSYKELLFKDSSLMGHMAIGLFCRKAFDSPFALHGTKGKLRVCDRNTLSYLIIAPVVFYFITWLMQEICKSQCEYVLYPSRDAYLIQKICEIVKENQKIETYPNGEYFYVSRRAVLGAAIWGEDDIKHVAYMDFWGSIKDLFWQRFHVEVEKEAEKIKATDRKQLEHYISQHKEEVLSECVVERENYLRYIFRTGIYNHKKIAFIDFVAVGKVQDGLERLLSDKDLQGFYFLRRAPGSSDLHKDIKIDSYYPSKGDFEIDSNVYVYYLFLELILTSFEPTFHSVDNEGNMRFMEETRSTEHCQLIRKIQEDIIGYCDEFSSLYPGLLGAEADRDIPDRILGFLDREYTTMDLEEISSLVLTDEFLSQTFNIWGK